MSDELRAAAESACEFADTIPSYTDLTTPACLAQAWSHFKRLAKAYRAKHPADDAEPVTEEWLRSMGWVSRMSFELVTPHRKGQTWTLIYNTDEKPDWFPRWSLQAPGIQQGLGYDLTSRGQVRRLLAALGVATKDVATIV